MVWEPLGLLFDDDDDDDNDNFTHVNTHTYTQIYNLPIWPLKTCSGLELVPKHEPSTY